MIPAGYGYEVLEFKYESLREIAKLPQDVRIVAALQPPKRNDYTIRLPPGWTHGVPLSSIFILICHRYCVRVEPGTPYMISPLEDFLKRYHQLDEDERMPLPIPDEANQMVREAWYRDADGKLDEYVYHEKAGWIPKWHQW